MPNFSVELECAVIGAVGHRVLDDFDRVADALADLDDVQDQDLACDADRGTLTFGMIVESHDDASALATAIAAARTALHAAGAGTAGWDDQYRVGASRVAAAVVR